MERIDPTRSAGFLVDRVAHSLHVRVGDFLMSEEIPQSAAEISILVVMDHLHTPERMGRLADLLGRDTSTLTRQLDGLVKAGLVSRERCPQDGRSVRATITAKGSQLVDRIMPLALALRKRTMRGISQTDSENLVRSLFQMLENLRDEA